jgi:hypothetical protein
MSLSPRLLRPLARRFLLDQYGGAAAAYSLRRLRTGYAGAAVRVRRSSDNAEENFTAEEIASGALTVWTGASDGFVVTWFDQSGNGRDATQATANNQPTIVSSGVLETLNGKPAILWPTSTFRRLQTASTITNTSSLTFSGVFSATRNSTNYHELWRLGPGTSTSGATYVVFAGGTFSDWSAGALIFLGDGFSSGRAPRIVANTNPITQSTTTQNDVFGVMSATRSALFANNSEAAYTVQLAGNVGSLTNQSIRLCNGPDNIQQLVGRTQEIVLWFEDRFGDRSGIRNNQRAFYDLS